MFYYIEGTVALTEGQTAVIDTGGVGYACNTTLNTLSQIEVGKRARLYTYTHIREDIFDIYGFATREELSCFKMLIGVTGVGPKAASTMLSAVSPEQLAMAVITEDEKMLTQAPGIGKKTAQRIILELKDKMKKEQLASASYKGISSSKLGFGSKASEALNALGVLGYTSQEASYAMQGLDTESLAVEDIIKQALRRMGSSK